MKYLFLIVLIAIFSCGKKHIQGYRTVTQINGLYVKLNGFNRWYYIPDTNIQKGDSIYFLIKHKN